MKKIYIGPIHTLHLKSLSFAESSAKLSKESFVLKKNALFYQNFFGKIINFEHNTCLPTRDEAEDYLESIIREKKDHNAALRNCSTIYYSEYDLKPLKTVSNEEFRQLKKSFKDLKNRQK